MRVLLVGGGGREHALAWRLRQDDPTTRDSRRPGQPGDRRARDLSAGRGDGYRRAGRRSRDRNASTGRSSARKRRWPPGIVDAFPRRRHADLRPDARRRDARDIQGVCERCCMLDAGVPTARAVTCETLYDAERAIAEIGAPCVVIRRRASPPARASSSARRPSEALHAATVDAERQRVRRRGQHGARRGVHGGRGALVLP